MQTDERGAYEIATRLAGWVVEAVGLRSSAEVRSHFGRIRFEDLHLDVEVMGAVRKLTTDGLWNPPTVRLIIGC